MILNPETKYLFDTTIFVDSVRKRPVAARLIQQARDEQVSASCSILTEAELWTGVQDSSMENDLQELLKPFQRYPLPASIAHRSGRILHQLRKSQAKGESLPGLIDCLIVATGEAYGLTICSGNTRHFAAFQRFSINIELYRET